MLSLISLLSFLLPTQLGLHLTNFENTVYGFQVDYLIPTLYLTDIISLAIIILGVIKLHSRPSLKFDRKLLVASLLYIAFVSINIYISDYFVASLYKWLKVTEMLLLGIIILNFKKFNAFSHFVKPLSYSVLIACVLGIMQFIKSGSIGGLFYWFGERSFLFSDPNIAPYPYSFFSHPNSFAGFLLVFGIFLLQYRNKFNRKYFWTLAVLVTSNLILTNSLNVYLAIVVLVFLRFRPNLSFAFLTFDFTQRFVTHRVELIKASLEMIKENLLFGVGLNNFIPNLVKVSKTFVNSWELQPVHNIFLLIFSEVGILGFVAFAVLLLPSFTMLSYPLYAILITGLSDHYWLTLQQNLLLFVCVVVISRKNKQSLLLRSKRKK